MCFGRAPRPSFADPLSIHAVGAPCRPLHAPHYTSHAEPVFFSAQDPRRDHLINRMGAIVSQLPAAPKELLKAYIEMSYDNSAAIERVIAEADPATPILVLETAQPVSTLASNPDLQLSTCPSLAHSLTQNLDLGV